jgi:glutamate 5-kinase
VTRALVAGARRIVIKIGSSSLTTAAGGMDAGRVDALVDAIEAALAGEAREIVLVSSGAISAGLAPLGLTRRPRDLATLQACASVGQLLLAERYAASFARYSRTVGQVLLTSEDVIRRAHYRNARRTLERLLSLGAVPILNENDTVATEEIRFSGNDRLAALVAHLIAADLLLLLTDVDGVYERNPRTDPTAVRLTEVAGPEGLGNAAFRGIGAAAVGSGGMQTKVDAALLAASEGCAALVGAAADLTKLLAGDELGTLFLPAGKRLPSRLRWLAHASAPNGRLHLDAGAVRALTTRGSSLLAAGITAVDGDFEAGDPVELVGPDGLAFGRGLVAYDSGELPDMLGRSTLELGPERTREVVHRDHLVLLQAPVRRKPVAAATPAAVPS